MKQYDVIVVGLGAGSAIVVGKKCSGMRIHTALPEIKYDTLRNLREPD